MTVSPHLILHLESITPHTRLVRLDKILPPVPCLVWICPEATVVPLRFGLEACTAPIPMSVKALGQLRNTRTTKGKI